VVSSREVDRRLLEMGRLFVEKLAARDAALVMQAKEYERRLEALNHEHEMLARMAGTYVSTVAYDADKEAVRLLAERTRERSETLERQQEANAQNNRRTRLTAIVGAAIAIIGWGITLILPHLGPAR
jgi:GGDEF domain-containing protein